jgi:outer membrane protein OmpA-like peptidoglycan-associated protein
MVKNMHSTVKTARYSWRLCAVTALASLFIHPMLAQANSSDNLPSIEIFMENFDSLRSEEPTIYAPVLPVSPKAAIKEKPVAVEKQTLHKVPLQKPLPKKQPKPHIAETPKLKPVVTLEPIPAPKAAPIPAPVQVPKVATMDNQVKLPIPSLPPVVAVPEKKQALPQPLPAPISQVEPKPLPPVQAQPLKDVRPQPVIANQVPVPPVPKIEPPKPLPAPPVMPAVSAPPPPPVTPPLPKAAEKSAAPTAEPRTVATAMREWLSSEDDKAAKEAPKPVVKEVVPPKKDNVVPAPQEAIESKLPPLPPLPPLKPSNIKASPNSPELPKPLVAAPKAAPLALVPPPPLPDEPQKIASLPKAQPTAIMANSSKKNMLVSLGFNKNQLVINDAEKQKIIAKLQNFIKTSERFTIISFASSDPDQSGSDRRISLQRAIAVRKLIIDLGIDEMRINVQALGDASQTSTKDHVDIFTLDE